MRSPDRVVITKDYSDRRWILDRFEQALTCRALGVQPPEEARGLMSASLAELAWHSNRVRGYDVPMGDTLRCIQLALGGSDFPFALANIAQAVLVETYQILSPAYRAISAPIELNSFRSANMVRVAEVPGLLRVGEACEVKQGDATDVGESIQLASFGRRLTLSLEDIVNDNVGALRDIGTGLAARQAEFENTLVMGSLVSGASGNGPTLRDGAQLFAAARGNLAGSGAAFSASTFSAARAALARATTPNGSALNLPVRTILCGPDQLDAIELELAKRTVAETTPIRVVADALVGTAWYAISNLLPLRHATLGGAGPIITSRTGFDVSGVELKFSYSFGVAALEPRGAYKNPGA
jgi:hypothetical protein